MSVRLLYNGDVVPEDVNRAIATLKPKRSIRFDDEVTLDTATCAAPTMKFEKPPATGLAFTAQWIGPVDKHGNRNKCLYIQNTGTEDITDITEYRLNFCPNGKKFNNDKNEDAKALSMCPGKVQPSSSQFENTILAKPHKWTYTFNARSGVSKYLARPDYPLKAGDGFWMCNKLIIINGGKFPVPINWSGMGQNGNDAYQLLKQTSDGNFEVVDQLGAGDGYTDTLCIKGQPCDSSNYQKKALKAGCVRRVGTSIPAPTTIVTSTKPKYHGHPYKSSTVGDWVYAGDSSKSCGICSISYPE